MSEELVKVVNSKTDFGFGVDAWAGPGGLSSPDLPLPSGPLRMTFVMGGNSRAGSQHFSMMKSRDVTKSITQKMLHKDKNQYSKLENTFLHFIGVCLVILLVKSSLIYHKHLIFYPEKTSDTGMLMSKELL